MHDDAKGKLKIPRFQRFDGTGIGRRFRQMGVHNVTTQLGDCAIYSQTTGSFGVEKAPGIDSC